jgi:hypothetical protein
MTGHFNSFSVALRPDAGQGHFTVEASQSHSDTPCSVGLLWTSDQPDAETFTWKYTTLTTNFHAPDGQTHALERSGTGTDGQLNYSTDITPFQIGY